jgi:hypothetical protein
MYNIPARSYVPVKEITWGSFWIFYVLYSTLLNHHRPLDFSVSEDAGIEPRIVATLALAIRHSNHSARSYPQG